MTYEELKEKLKQLRDTKRRIRQLDAQIAEAKATIDGVGAFRFDSVAVQGGKREPVQQKYVERMERLLSNYNKLREDMANEVGTTEEYLSHMGEGELTPIEQSILTDRYINCKSWREIQAEYHYENRQPYDIVKNAIKKLLEIKSPQ